MLPIDPLLKLYFSSILEKRILKEVSSLKIFDVKKFKNIRKTHFS